MVRLDWIAWTHPSCRDLVIEEITQNRELGLQFLRSATLDGIKLAISDTGGTEGNRVRPLMNFPGSWGVLRERCLTLVDAGSGWELTQLLSVVTSGLKTASMGILRNEFENLLQLILSKGGQKWNAGNAVLTPHQLSVYYEASILVSPLPPSPVLASTWNNMLQGIRNALQKAEEGGKLDVDAVEKWASLCSVIKNNEPRFLRQVGFPDLFISDFGKILEVSEQEVERSSRVSSAEEAREFAQDLLELADALDEISLASDGKFEGAKATASELKQEAEDLENRAYELDPPEEDTREETRSTSPSREDFDIASLFADL